MQFVAMTHMSQAYNRAPFTFSLSLYVVRSSCRLRMRTPASTSEASGGRGRPNRWKDSPNWQTRHPTDLAQRPSWTFSKQEGKLQWANTGDSTLLSRTGRKRSQDCLSSRRVATGRVWHWFWIMFDLSSILTWFMHRGRLVQQNRLMYTFTTREEEFVIFYKNMR